MTMALILAVPRRLIEGSSILTEGKNLAGLVADLDARPSHRGKNGSVSSAWAASAQGRGTARPCVRPADPLSQPPSCRAAHRRRTWARPYWESLDQMLGADGHHLGELSAYAGDIPFCCRHGGLKLIRKDAYIVNTARGGGDRRRHHGQADRIRRESAAPGSTCSRMRPAVNPKTGAARQGRQR